MTKSTSMPRIAIQAPCSTLVMTTTTSTTAVNIAPIRLMARDRLMRALVTARSAALLGVRHTLLEHLRPVPDHARLAEREGRENPDDVQLDQPIEVGVEAEDQADRGAGQQQDAIAVDEPITPGLQLPGQEAVLGEDRGQHREAVERRVRSEDEDAGRDDLEVARTGTSAVPTRHCASCEITDGEPDGRPGRGSRPPGS